LKPDFCRRWAVVGARLGRTSVRSLSGGGTGGGGQAAWRWLRRGEPLPSGKCQRPEIWRQRVRENALAGIAGDPQSPFSTLSQAPAKQKKKNAFSFDVTSLCRETPRGGWGGGKGRFSLVNAGFVLVIGGGRNFPFHAGAITALSGDFGAGGRGRLAE